MGKVVVKYKKLDPKKAAAPYRKHEDDAGFDLVATSFKLEEYGVHDYGLGIAIELPKGYWADIRPRSSIYKTGLSLCNSCGVIDNSYRGELRAKFYKIVNNLHSYDVGERCCQIIIANANPEDVVWEEVDELSDTPRSDGGFGSTGK